MADLALVPLVLAGHGWDDYALLDIGQQIIAPAHIWSEVEDTTKFANEEPVGTGPYTEVTNFQSQSFDLGKNPEYWQPEKQQVEAMVRMLLPGATIRRSDAADALAVAICHAHHRQSRVALARAYAP